MDNRQPALTIDHLTVSYDRSIVLWDISLSVPQGTLTCIVGPNGAGKSTLMKAVLGIVPMLSGKIEFFGQPLKQMRQRVAYVPQRESVDWDFPITVLDLVVMGRYGKLGLFRRPRSADRVAALNMLEAVGMKDYAERQISQLSGGQQQRAFLARALLQEADIYFLDEPFAGIDAATEAVIVKILQELRSKGKTLLVVHHELRSVESYFDAAIMLNVRLVAHGPVADTFTAENLSITYGKNDALFEEAITLSEKKRTGIGL